ncbi:MAG TPA: hypothetical protein VF852_16340, partial [Pseudolabrys sp.]
MSLQNNKIKQDCRWLIYVPEFGEEPFFIGGEFYTVDKWDGTSWHGVGGTYYYNSYAYALFVFDDGT